MPLYRIEKLFSQTMPVYLNLVREYFDTCELIGDDPDDYCISVYRVTHKDLKPGHYFINIRFRQSGKSDTMVIEEIEIVK